MNQYVLLIIATLLIISCNDGDSESALSDIECEKISTSFLDKDHSYAKIKIDSICNTLPPNPTATDTLGHEINTQTLLEILNQSCDQLDFKLNCYARLESYPLKSSISVKLDSMGIEITRYFNIAVPEDDFMYK